MQELKQYPLPQAENGTPRFFTLTSGDVYAPEVWKLVVQPWTFMQLPDVVQPGVLKVETIKAHGEKQIDAFLLTAGAKLTVEGVNLAILQEPPNPADGPPYHHNCKSTMQIVPPPLQQVPKHKKEGGMVTLTGSILGPPPNPYATEKCIFAGGPLRGTLVALPQSSHSYEHVMHTKPKKGKSGNVVPNHGEMVAVYTEVGLLTSILNDPGTVTAPPHWERPILRVFASGADLKTQMPRLIAMLATALRQAGLPTDGVDWDATQQAGLPPKLTGMPAPGTFAKGGYIPGSGNSIQAFINTGEKIVSGTTAAMQAIQAIQGKMAALADQLAVSAVSSAVLEAEQKEQLKAQKAFAKEMLFAQMYGVNSLEAKKQAAETFPYATLSGEVASLKPGAVVKSPKGNIIGIVHHVENGVAHLMSEGAFLTKYMVTPPGGPVTVNSGDTLSISSGQMLHDDMGIGKTVPSSLKSLAGKFLQNEYSDVLGIYAKQDAEISGGSYAKQAVSWNTKPGEIVNAEPISFTTPKSITIENIKISDQVKEVLFGEIAAPLAGVSTSLPWSDPNSNPLKDIQDMMKKLEMANYKPVTHEIKMHPDALQSLKKSLAPEMQYLDSTGGTDTSMQLYGAPVHVDATLAPNVMSVNGVTYQIPEPGDDEF